MEVEGAQIIADLLKTNTTLTSVKYAAICPCSYCQQPLTPRFGPCSQSPGQRCRSRGRKGTRRGPEDELDAQRSQVRRHSPISLLSAAADTVFAPLFAASATTNSMRRPQSTSRRASSRTRPSRRSSTPPHTPNPTVSSHLVAIQAAVEAHTKASTSVRKHRVSAAS